MPSYLVVSKFCDHCHNLVRSLLAKKEKIPPLIEYESNSELIDALGIDEVPVKIKTSIAGKKTRVCIEKGGVPRCKIIDGKFKAKTKKAKRFL